LISGIVIPTITPMNDKGIHLQGVETLVEFLISKKVNALFVNGTTGEGPLLSLQERIECTETAIKTANKRLPIIVQVGASTTKDSIDLAIHSAEAGAEAVACITPSFFAYSDKELLSYYQEVARAIAPLPLYLYNIPARTGNSISAQVATELANEPNIIGVKDSTGNMAQILDYLAIEDFDVIPGADFLATQIFVAGGKGIVSGPAGIFPEPFVALWEAWQAKDYGAMLYWQGIVMQISRIISHGGRLDILKGLMAKRLEGIGEVRAPLRVASSGELEPIQNSLHSLLKETTLQEDAYNWLS